MVVCIMTQFNIRQLFLDKYTKYMHLKLFIDSDDISLKNKYIEYINNRELKIIKDSDHVDAGFDIFVPNGILLTNGSVNKLDYMISCSAQIVKSSRNHEYIKYNTGYYMYPRSSISKTSLRLANNVGIIDAGYRGHLIGMFDILYNVDEVVRVDKYDRHLQICSPELIPIYVELVNTKEELGENTIRGNGGFGSTGV